MGCLCTTRDKPETPEHLETLPHRYQNKTHDAPFVPDQIRWVIIKNRDYSGLRSTHAAWKTFADIPQVDDDARHVRKGF